MNAKLKSAAAAAALMIFGAGSAQASCHVFGTAGDDTLSSPIPCFIAGFGGTDTITGSSGQDVIYPGSNFGAHLGFDVMTGGGDADAFVFETSNSMGANAARVTDFEHGVDQVFVKSLCFAASVTCFWIGNSAFSGTAGETRYSASTSAFGLIEIDLDGDASADYQIKLMGAPTFDEDDINFTSLPGGGRFVKEHE